MPDRIPSRVHVEEDPGSYHNRESGCLTERTRRQVSRGPGPPAGCAPMSSRERASELHRIRGCGRGVLGTSPEVDPLRLRSFSWSCSCSWCWAVDPNFPSWGAPGLSSSPPPFPSLLLALACSLHAPGVAGSVPMKRRGYSLKSRPRVSVALLVSSDARRVHD